ncbi:MAG: metalloprotease TldD [Sphingobium sp.]|nr:metalloprotease TldD [Sphingobium sp.]
MNTPTLSPEHHLARAENILLTANDLDRHHLNAALDALAGGQCDFADLYFESTSREEWRLERGKVTNGAFSISQGVGARALSGDKAAFAYSSDVGPRALHALSDAAKSMQRQGQDAFHTGGAAIPVETQREGNDSYPQIAAAQTWETARKLALLRAIDDSARSSDPRIAEVMASLVITDSVILTAASSGMLAGDTRPLIDINVRVLAESNSKRAGGSAGVSGRFALSDISQEAIDEMIAKAVRTALVNLDSRPAPAGVMSVVLGSGFPGVLLHEAVGHGLEGDAHRKRISVFSDRIGEKIAASGVNVVDDGSVPLARGSLSVDDEGHAGRRNMLIEDGKLVGLMQDQMNAGLMNAAVTGNGRRQSYAHMPMPRMTNTFLENGDYDPAEIIASVKQGIYAAEFGGGTVDITSGQFNFSATEAYLIEDGQVTAPLAGATLIGVGHEALQHISMIGNNLKLAAGVCGKNGQSVPVCVGQPTIRIDDMVVGGAGQ